MEYLGKQGTAHIPSGSQTTEQLSHSGPPTSSMTGAGSHRTSPNPWKVKSQGSLPGEGNLGAES